VTSLAPALEAKTSDRRIMRLQGGGGNQVNPRITVRGNPENRVAGRENICRVSGGVGFRLPVRAGSDPCGGAEGHLSNTRRWPFPTFTTSGND
jgi:hypothetical protein